MRFFLSLWLISSSFTHAMDDDMSSDDRAALELYCMLNDGPPTYETSLNDEELALKLYCEINNDSSSPSTNDDDYLVALKLQQQEEDAELAKTIEYKASDDRNHAQLMLDGEMALRMQKISLEMEPFCREAQTSLKPLIEICANAFDQDVHKFNHAIQWKTNLPKLFAIQDKLSSTIPQMSAVNFFAVFEAADFYRHLDQNQIKDDFQKNKAILLDHLSKNDVELKETGASISTLLSRIWALSEERADQCERLGSLLLSIMIDNKATGGGCFPGFSGRLCEVYLRLLNDKVMFN